MNENVAGGLSKNFEDPVKLYFMGRNLDIVLTLAVCWIRWSLGGSTGHKRSDTIDVKSTWNYTVNVAEGGVSKVSATAVQSYLATTYTATLDVTLDSGTLLSIPVTGIYEGENTSPVVRNI